MKEKCKKCGNVAEGESYTFFHGNKGKEIKQEIKGAKASIQLKTIPYWGISSTTYHLCINCVNQRVRRTFIIGLTGGVVFAALSIFFWLAKTNINFLPGLVMICLGIVVLYGFPLLSLILFASGFMALKRKVTGENLAIEIGKKEILTSNSFWNNDEYKKISKV